MGTVAELSRRSPVGVLGVLWTATLVGTALFAVSLVGTSVLAQTHVVPLFLWSAAQWLPVPMQVNRVHGTAWKWWDGRGDCVPATDIPVVDVQAHDDVLSYLQNTYGPDWRSRPLLLKNLWDGLSLNDPNRRLSVPGLLNETLRIPYFKDSTVPKAFTPDASAAVGDIVRNITNGAPHKIGTQLIVQEYPHLVGEVAPSELVTELFGDHFQQRYILGNTAALPGTLTVPVFLANGLVQRSSSMAADADADVDATNVRSKGNEADTELSNVQQTCDAASCPAPSPADQPVTGMHSEPIANIAVQLSGSKTWTLVEPKHSFRLKPALAPDGRAFFASFETDIGHVPRYKVVTHAGDAVWVPTWTWHQVDYTHETSLSASLFHFRGNDFVKRNPVFAFLLLPAMIKEALGISTQ